ncbi:nucleotidyltransferase domain-containing protein [Candidatus Pacearchaeota archaeon]|jgi:tRNA nucleotidyltransferase (CCA-adding enzyme)|nr:nucleotidyltransferase domain-containing protein [Candidatus Pacearchaeota archaeon]
MKNINYILKEVLIKINPPEIEIKSIEKFLKGFINNLKGKLKTINARAEVFVGGSFAKNTLIKKGLYDIDVFVRFDEKYKEKDISKLLERALKGTRQKYSVIHGSRDYFKIDVDDNFFIELIPVIKVKNPKEAGNITDLSYFHVNYIEKKLNKNMIDDVRLAKAFCHANKCYGAESYINGFSGYALELLIIYYKNFLNFLRAMTRVEDREIIDIEKLYKNKQELIMNMNSAKMSSPIILIDPTYKERNALAALSKETFEEFKKACSNFLKNPKEESFQIKRADLEKIKENANKKKEEFVLLNLETNKQEGDIAGSKLVKFYKHLGEELEKFYKIINKGFEYDGEKNAEAFFVVKSKGEIIFNGPSIKDKKNMRRFKKRHKKTLIKNGKIFAKEKASKNIKEFITDWMSANYQKTVEMSISEIKIEN